MSELRVGALLYGYCEGWFGRYYEGCKRVEALGVDWVVARDKDGKVFFANVEPERLIKFTAENND